MTALLLDVESLLATPDWRSGLRWPVAYESCHTLGATRLERLFACVHAEADPSARDLLFLMAGGLSNHATWLAETAIAIDAARRQGLHPVAADPELRLLLGTGTEDALPPPTLRAKFGRTDGAALRRIARTASWTPWPRLPRALLAPDAVAVTHNPVLTAAARAGEEAIGFHHAESWLAEARAAQPMPPADPQAAALADRAADALLGDLALADDLAPRVRALVLRRARSAFAIGASDIAGARTLRRLPRRLWSGSLGNYSARLLAGEVRRRGGQVHNFDHTTGRGLHVHGQVTAWTELAFSDHFVTFTPEMARLTREGDPARWLPDGRRPEIAGGPGDPQVRSVAFTPRPRPAARPRVLYASTILRGPRQSVPPQPPDPVYLEWQLWLAETLQTLPIELVCRPHPEGALSGRPHPLSAVAPVAGRSFEELLGAADVVLFDEAVSTTLYETLCTELPVVFLDFGSPYYTAHARSLLAARCRVLSVGCDARNRMRVEPQALADALLDPHGPVDPMPWRRLFLG